MNNLRRFVWLLTECSNGFALIENLRSGGMLGDGPPMQEVLFRDGLKITHPHNRSGLIGTFLEIWYENVYRIGEFYTPHKGDLVLDIGAHVGFFAIFVAKKQIDCDLICIEASKENFQHLKLNTKPFENIVSYNLGLGSEGGRIKTVVDTNRSIDTRVIRADNDDPEGVEILPINDLFELTKSKKINLMKMDIEGSELDVFKKIDMSIINCIEKICLEYHDNVKPGTLAFLEKKLNKTHNIEVFPDKGTGHGMLFASIR